jgi:ubiquinone/menaquinone biosynthesis C-methylase UbiE
MNSRKQEEQNFHNKLRNASFAQRWAPEIEDLIHNDPLWTNMKYYSIERESRFMVLNWLRQNCKDKQALDYCCGNGEDSIFLAKNGVRKVIGIDISEKSIENCINRAFSEGVQDKAFFLVMDAEALQFEDNSFDIVTEYGALHHLDLLRAYSEISRVLKHNGKAICVEALKHNPLIHIYRKMTPNLRTPWEVDHILGKKELYLAKNYFNKVEVYFFHLLSLLAVPLRNTQIFNRLLSALEKIDNLLLKQSFIKWQAWQAVVILSEPKKR